jgi:predicted dienelactone hydrolase
MWLVKAILVLIVLAVLGIALLLGSLWVEHWFPATLPAPTGRFAVGRTMYHWSDEAQPALLAPSAAATREVIVWLWYPAEPRGPASAVQYFPQAWRKAFEDKSGVLMNRFLNRNRSAIHAHSIEDAPLSPSEQAYPVLIMRPGLSALSLEYSTLAEDLASHGYIVVSFDAPYRSTVVVLPDNRVIGRTPANDADAFSGAAQELLLTKLMLAWCSDMRFVVDRLQTMNAAEASSRFAGRMDLNRLGVFGHSLGGATAAQFCHNDSRCKAGIDVDGAPHGSVIREGVRQPFMFLLSDHGRSSGPDSGQVEADIDSIYQSLPPQERMRVMIRGANHYSFSDSPVVKSHMVQAMLYGLGIMGIDGRRQLAVAAYCIRSFFDVYLKGASRSALEIPSARYPELRPFG